MQSTKVPRRRYILNAMQIIVSSLHQAHVKELLDGATDTLLGHRVPDFQRKNDKWSRAEQVAFIESMYLGANIGAFMLNISNNAQVNNLLLDGLQRLTALKAYFMGDFGVKGEDGVERKWIELEHEDQVHLLRITFPMMQTQFQTKAECLEAYIRHNFTGRAHTDADRAHALGVTG